VNGRTRIACSAAFATMLTSLCLWPLVTPAHWIFQAWFMVLVTAGAGLGFRRLGLPRPLIPAAQFLTVLLILTPMFASGQAILGFLPGPGAFTQFADLFGQGFDEMGQYGIPAPVEPGLRLILIGAVFLVALLVDTLAVTYQRVALAGLPLLALYSVGTGLHSSGAVWLWFLLSAGGYLGLLLAEGHDRLSRWGRVFHGSPATLAGTSGGNPLSSTGYRIGGLALAAGLLLPLALPSLGTGLIGSYGHNGEGLGSGGTIITAVNPLASLAQTLTQPADQTVLTYTTTSTSAANQYLRIVDLDDFDGVKWTTSQHQVVNLPTPLPSPPTGLSTAVAQSTVLTNINTEDGYDQQWLPMPYPATNVTAPGDWKYEPEGRTLIGADGTNAGGLQYSVTSLVLDPTTAQLRDAPAPSAAFLKTYTALPKNLPAVVHADALQVTQGATSAYDEAVDLQKWFTTTGGFVYNANVPADTGSNAIATFLTNREGFCVHFAATMAAMARSLGIPARVAIGFTPGTQLSPNTWEVSTKDAHAWPELYFSGIGWLRFEPTPSIGIAPSYSIPGTTSTSSTTSSSSATTSAQPSGQAGKAPACSRAGLRSTGGCPTGATGPAASSTGSRSWPYVLLLVLAGIAALLLLVMLVPMLWRISTRRSRLRPTGREPGEQQVLDTWAELLDSAWDLGIAPDEAETPRRAIARIMAAGGLTGESREAAGRLAVATEQALYAPAVAVPATLGSDLRSVRTGLRASVGRRDRARAVLLPPSRARLHRRLRETRQRTVRAVSDPLRTAARRASALVGRLTRREDGTGGTGGGAGTGAEEL
jgi:transglutaminase-like putative cysteine protease